MEVRTYYLCHTGNLRSTTKRKIIYYLTLSSFLAAIKRCPNPEDIDHGSVRVFGSYAWYRCDRGHALRGQSMRYCDLLTGEWEEPAPTCEGCELTTIPITIIQPWDIMLIHSAHYVQHLSTVDILETLSMEQWMSLKGLNYMQLFGTHVMKDSYAMDQGLEHVDLMADGVGQPLLVKVRHYLKYHMWW